MSQPSQTGANFGVFKDPPGTGNIKLVLIASHLKKRILVQDRGAGKI
jgi:hypothetical protein